MFLGNLIGMVMKIKYYVLRGLRFRSFNLSIFVVGKYLVPRNYSGSSEIDTMSCFRMKWPSQVQKWENS